jgi:hypothetical protein
MLFLGTEKYPDENSYSSFLATHGGNSNAFTASETTNYHFEIQAPYLEVLPEPRGVVPPRFIPARCSSMRGW